MKYIAALMVVAMATIASGESVPMMELTPSLGSGSDCEVSLWCRDYATAARCGKVAYCREWIWEDTMPAITCDQCKTEVGKLLSENVTIIDDMCELIPLTVLQKECEKFLEKEIAGVTPLKVCQAFDMCPKSRETQPDEDVCGICKLLAKELLSNLDEVKSILDDVCKKTPVSAECDLVVDAIISALKNVNESYICKEVHACKNVSRQLLGGDLCTQGPSYWCDSLDNAKECGAFDYCTKKYWV